MHINIFRNIDKLNQLGITTDEVGTELSVEDIPPEYDRFVTDEPVSLSYTIIYVKASSQEIWPFRDSYQFGHKMACTVTEAG